MKKMTKLILQRMHEGYLLEQVPAYRICANSDQDDVWRLLTPQFDDRDTPNRIIDCIDPPKDVQRYFPLDRGYDLLFHNLIIADDFSPRLHCFTTAGVAVATRYFGAPSIPLLVRPNNLTPA